MEFVYAVLLLFFATSLGALFVLVFGAVDKLKQALLLAFSAGVMAYTVVEMALQSRVSGDVVAAAGVFAGFVAIAIFEKLMPHLHRELSGRDSPKRKAALLAGTVTIHNIPEGLAAASAFAASPALGWATTLSIAIQDVPEGFVVSGPLASYGMRTRKAIALGILSGAIEAAAMVLGYAALSTASSFVPVALAFSAGAMAYVVLVEMLPDALSGEHARWGGMSFAVGVAVAFAMALAFIPGSL